MYFYINIGATNISRLIVIMLGRLKIDVNKCIAAYTGLIKTIFKTKRSWFLAS